MDYKDSIFLPKTNFPMRGNLATKEQEIQEFWEKEELYRKVLEKNKDGFVFAFHDGPPYANNDIHSGHAFQKSLKDFIIRYHLLKGDYVSFIPGWDTHGLPIENEVAKKLNRKTTDPVEFREKCREYALVQVEKQKTQFKRLGILGFWDKPYLTLTNDFIANEIKIFSIMVNKGLVYQGSKPIYYSPSSESALAEAEIEYFDETDPSIYVKFSLTKPKFKELFRASLLVWTTTPWTIPVNQAVAVNPSFTYVLIKCRYGKLVVLEKRLEHLTQILNINKYQILASYQGKDLENLTYFHPLTKKVCPVILGLHVEDSAGTGLVHTAPAHGEDDYNVGKNYKLDIVNVVDKYGKMNENAPKYQGVPFLEANELVIADLIEAKKLLKKVDIVHSYPHDWRTKKRVIYLSTPQWFVSLSLIQDQLVSEVGKVKWLPSWGEIRLKNMMESRSDWCISRQRLWGVPIPILYDDEKPILDKEVIDHISDIFKEEGPDVWFSKDAQYFLTEENKAKYNLSTLTKEKDTLDVWFDSGTSYMVIKDRETKFPVDLYFEGTDQYRGWFNSSLITSVAAFGKAPYLSSVTHGFVLDGQGRKMSKSLGNTVNPLDIIKQYGADVLRLWASNVDFKNDVRIGTDSLVQVSEQYRKIRNTIRYMLGVLDRFDPEKDYISYSMRSKMDRIASKTLFKINDLIIDCYENYNYVEINKILMPYIINFLSAFYLDYTKDIVYIEEFDNFERLAILSVIYDNLMVLLPLLNPILPHTTSEAYLELVGHKQTDVLLESIEKINHTLDSDLVAKFDEFLLFRDEVLLKLEQAREQKIIGKSLEASVSIVAPKETIELFKYLELNLKTILIVSDLKVTEGDKLEIKISKFEGKVCKRCWALFEELDSDELCERCSKIIKERE